MSLQSLPVKEFCHEINFLPFTQAGGDTDKMLTCKRDCTLKNPIFIMILKNFFFEKTAILWYISIINDSKNQKEKNHKQIWISQCLDIFMMKFENRKEMISSKKGDILPNQSINLTMWKCDV